MRILTYNIWDGGGERLRGIADVIRHAAPDAVALQEATPVGAEVLATELEMELVFGESNSIFDLHVAWLTRLPIQRAHNHRLPTLSKTLLELEVAAGLRGFEPRGHLAECADVEPHRNEQLETALARGRNAFRGRSSEPQAQTVRLFATHLASRHEIARHPIEREVATILDVLATVGEPHLLVGDLNALRPPDGVGEPPPGVVPRGEAVPGAPRTSLDPLVRGGYVDCYRALRDDPGYTYTAAHPWLRLDYAFASPSLAPRLRACTVEATEAARRASDHLPLLVELD